MRSTVMAENPASEASRTPCFRLRTCVRPIHPRQCVVVKRLNANAEALHPGAFPSVKLGTGEVFRVGFQRHLLQRGRIEVERFGNALNQSRDGPLRQQRGRAASEIQRLDLVPLPIGKFAASRRRAS